MPGSFAVTGQQLHRQLGQILAAPDSGGDKDPLELVRAAYEVQDRAGALRSAAVHRAREAGRTWHEIGEVLGVSPQAVFQRYGKPIDPRTGDVMNASPLPE